MASTLRLSVHTEAWVIKTPFRISGYEWTAYKVNMVELADGQYAGRGESTPVHNLNETAEGVCEQIEAAAATIELGIDREDLLKAMPPGSGRHAIDCALWDLEAKRAGKSIWELTGINPSPVSSSFTIGLENTPQEMATRAAAASTHQILKIKVGRELPVERVAAIRSVRPDAILTIDANQGWTFAELCEFAPKLKELGVKMIEQPLPRGADEALQHYESPIPLCADESCQHRGELDEVASRYQIINVKLDKAGGLTEALLLAQSCEGGDANCWWAAWAGPRWVWHLASYSPKPATMSSWMGTHYSGAIDFRVCATTPADSSRCRIDACGDETGYWVHLGRLDVAAS